MGKNCFFHEYLDCSIEKTQAVRIRFSVWSMEMQRKLDGKKKIGELTECSRRMLTNNGELQKL